MQPLEIYKSMLAETGDVQAAATLTLAHLIAAEPNGERSKSEWLTIKEAAAEFNLSQRSLYRLTGLHRRNGKTIRLKRSELRAYLEGEGTRLH